METLFSNLSTYNVLNFIFPGATMCYAARYFLGLKLPTELSMLSELLLYYFVGLTISRIATLFVEYFCRETKLIVYADYSDYLYAEKVDAKIAVLNEQNNSYFKV